MKDDNIKDESNQFWHMKCIIERFTKLRKSVKNKNKRKEIVKVQGIKIMVYILCMKMLHSRTCIKFLFKFQNNTVIRL